MELTHFDVEEVLFTSRALAGNPARDPESRRIPVILPRSRHEDPGRKYPLVLVLAGYAGAGRQFLGYSAWTPNLPERLDRLRARGEIGDVVVVCPDAFTVFGGSQYRSSAATGNYEEMIVEDLVPWLDARYPTLPAARNRAIVGKSSGGYGALYLGMRHPDIFGAVACHAGDMYFEYCYLPDFPKLLRQIEKHGSLDAFIRAFLAAPKKTSELVLAMNIVAMAAAYSPAPAAPWRLELPFDPRTGRIREEIWNRWLAEDPVRLCERYAPQLKQLRLLYLDCGRLDQFHLQFGLRIFAERLSALGVPHVIEEFDDDHSDTSYRYEVSFPRLWQAIRSGGN